MTEKIYLSLHGLQPVAYPFKRNLPPLKGDTVVVRVGDKPVRVKLVASQYAAAVHDFIFKGEVI